MGMFGPREGSWWLRSKKDPRWNTDGRAYVGGFLMPEACRSKIDELKLRFGEPPEDLEWGYMKD
ncbi:MAG TPA: hypothetical protein VI432_02940 [Candidatus Paceibacterota bacterium]